YLTRRFQANGLKEDFSRKGAKAQRKTQRKPWIIISDFFAPLRLCGRNLYAPHVADSPQNITELLVGYGRGDKEALDQLMPIVYEELRRQAARYLRREQAGHTLQTTAL